MAKRSQYKMLYRSEWETEETLKDWILPVPDDHRKAQCKYCGIKLSAYYAGLCSHALDKKHMKNVSAGGNAVGIRPLLTDCVDKEFSDARSVETVSGFRSTSVNDSEVSVGRHKTKRETFASKQENLSKRVSFFTMPEGNGDESEFLKMECEAVDEKSLAVLKNASTEKSRYRKKQVRLSSPARCHLKQVENKTLDGSPDSQSDVDSTMDKDPGICETASSMDDIVLGRNSNLLSAVKLKALSPELNHSDAGEPAVKRRKLDPISDEEFIAEGAVVMEVKRELLEDGALTEDGLSPESVSEKTEVLQRKQRKSSKSKIDWKRYKKAYRREWELDPALSDWLAPIDGDRYKAACKFCGCVLRAHYTDLQQHRSTAKHSRNAYWYQVKILNPDAADNCLTAYESLMEEKEGDSCGQTKESKISACYMLSKSPWSRYRKRYRKQWESDPQFQGWIASVPGDDTKARCKYCCILLRAHLADLKNHSRTTKHANNIAYGKPFPDSSTANRPGIIRTCTSLKSSVFSRKKKSSTKNASVLSRVDNFDLNRPDDSLAPIGSLTNLTTFGWSSSSLPETTLILPKHVHLDETLAASLPKTSPATMFRVKKEPGTAQTSPVKKRKEKLQVQMTPEECNENSLQSLTKSVTLWEFLMMKVEKSHPNSTRPKLETVLLEFKALQEQVKGLGQQQLTPLATDDKAKDSHRNDVLVIESEELAFCLGVPVGAYKIRDTTNPRMNRNINLLGNAPRRRTKHSSTAGSVATDQSNDQLVITNSVQKLIAAGDSEIQQMVIPSDQLQGVKLIGYDFDRQYTDNLFTVNGHYEGEGDVQLYVLPISEEMDQETLNTLMQGAPVTK